MVTILSTEVVERGNKPYGLFTVKSDSGSHYRVDVTNGRCSCPGWKFQRKGPDGNRKPCKHLLQFGFTADTQTK